MIPATVLLGSMAAGGLGLYLRGSTGPSELEKTVDDSVSAVTQQVSAATQQVSDATQQVTESVSDFVEPDDNPEPVAVPKPVPAEPVEPVPVEPVEQPVESVEQPMVKTSEQLARQVDLEDRDSMHPIQGQSLSAEEANELRELKKIQGGQRGGYGRPTWAPLNSGSSLMQALGVQPGSTAGNLLATATGSKTPQQIQQELVAVEQEIRRLKTQEFLTTKTLTDESTSFAKIRADYTKQVNKRERSKNLLKIYERELASILDPKPATSDLKPEVFAKFPRNKADGTPMFTKKDKGGKDVDDFDAWKKDAYTKASALPDGDQLKPLAGDDANKWWNKLSSGPGSAKKTSATELTKLLDDKETETTNLENAEQEIYKLKFTFETKQKIVEELRSQVREFIDKSREAEKRKEELLEELSEYKVPTSFWDKNKRPEAPRSAVPTGEELNRLLVEYKDIQELIKQKQEEIDEEVGIQLEDGNLKDSTNYDTLNTEKGELEQQRQDIIAKIEGRSTDQTKQIRALNELDIFIKQLKEQKVKAVTLFDNPDFRKVFDMLTLMSLDSDAKSFVVNMDKYSNFFVTTKGFSAYNGEVLDKVFYFFNNYETLIKDGTTVSLISDFDIKFTDICVRIKKKIEEAKTFLETSGDTTTDEFKKLDATQRRILEGRSTAWHTFFTDSDRLKAIPRAFSSVLFKTELDKLVKLEGVIKRRILDKIDKTKFETVTTAPSVALTGLSWYTRYIPDVSAWFTSKPADRKQFLLAFCKKFKEENIQKIERFDKEFEKYEKLITEKATKGINGSLLTISDAISELKTIIQKTEKERDRRLDPKLKRRIQADIDDYTHRKITLETNLNSYKNERKSSMQLKEITLAKASYKDLIAKLELLKDDENCLKNAETVLKDIRLLNRCDEIFQRVLAEQKDILKDLPKLEQYLRSALRQQGDFSPAEIEDCIKRKLNELEDPFNSCVNFVYSELTGDERNGKTEITDKRIQEIVDASNGKITTEQVKECILKAKARIPKLPGLTPIVITPGPVTDRSITLSWTGADGAEFTLDGTKVTSPHTINGLTPNTDYTYKIIGTLGKDTVESTIKVKTDPAPVPVKDAGTDTNKLGVCLEKVGELFLWNGNTYMVDSVIEKEDSIGCITKCTALLGTDKYNVELDKTLFKITKFEIVVPVLNHFVDLVTKLPKAGGTSLEKWRVYDTLGDGNCLIHAFVQATDPTYNGKTINEKLESVKTTRTTLAKATKSDGTSYFRSDRIKTDGEWLFTEDLEDLLNFVQTQTKPNKLVALIFDASKSTATANNPLGLSLSLGSYKLNTIPDDTDIIFIHATGTHFSSISDATGNFIMKYSEANKIPELTRALTPRLFPTMEFKKFTDETEIVKSGGGIISSVKYEGRDYIFKDLRSQKSPTGGKQPNAGDWNKILEDIESDPVYTNMKNDKNTHLISPLFLVLDDSGNKIGYTMKFLDKSYVPLSTILQKLLTEQQLKEIIKELMLAYKELKNSGTMACPDHANNIMISNFGKPNQHTVIIDLDDTVIKCKANTEQDALNGLGLIFDGYNTPNVNLPDSFKWLFNLSGNDKILNPGINTFDDLEKLASIAVSPPQPPQQPQPPPTTGGPLNMPLLRAIKSRSITNPFDSEGWIRTLQDDISKFNKTYASMKLETKQRSANELSAADFPNFNALILLIQTIAESLITNKVVTIAGDIATLRSLYDIEKYKDGTFTYQSVYTKFNIDTTKKLTNKGVSTINFLNQQLGLVQSKMKGGNHETRRHRVRGMPKRAKTRRMY